MNTGNDKELSLVYENTPGIQKLVTRETAAQILSEDFPRHNWPISGGWGYTKDDAVVIELDNTHDGVAMEYKFLEYRSYEEGIIFRPKDQMLSGFRFEHGAQALIIGDDGRRYDRVFMDVTAYKSEDWDLLKNDWESHNAYQNDEFGKNEHLALAESMKIKYTVVGWFDITNFFGKG